MPGGTVDGALNITSKFAAKQSHYILIAIVLAMIFVVYTKRLFKIEWKYFPIVITVIVLLLMSLIILSTICHFMKISNPYVDNFNSVFNSSGSRNFFAVILLLFFVIYIYELPQFDNNAQQHILDQVTCGNNNFISNRTMGIILIFGFGIFTAYTIMLTTRGTA